MKDKCGNHACNDNSKNIVSMDMNLLSNIAHDLRSPIGAIVNFARLMARPENDESREVFLKYIEDNYSLVSKLIDDVIDVTKSQSGIMSMSVTDVDVNDLMRDVFNNWRYKNGKEKVKVTLDPMEEEVRIDTDAMRVTQVLNNLICNALKFTDEGEVRIGMVKQGGRVKFYVIDTGRGIAEEDQEVIFNRFTEVGAGAYMKGYGLGLTIIRDIVTLLGGEVGVTSELGKGSTFWFVLPVHQDGAAAATADNALPEQKVDRKDMRAGSESTEKEIEDAKRNGKKVVMVAEDDTSNYHLVEMLLGKTYVLLHALDGVEAVDMFKTYRPDIVLMDIGMPNMDGYQAFSEIRKLDGKTPVVAVTSYAFANEKEEILNYGFTGYITKPINIASFAKEISEFAEKTI